jgi:UDP-N-acetylmuramyl pentapeptide phosphotransferase/UDP-N-acetylglucosamine-1-phosphate transferase
MSYLLVLFSFFISMILAMIVIPRILVIASKHSLYDIPDNRKTHTGAIPRIGGVSFTPCILISMLFVLSLFYMFDDVTEMRDYYYPKIYEFCLFFCGLLFLYLGGIKDDLIGMRFRAKFAIQIIASILIVFSGLYINNFYGFLTIYEVPIWIGIPLTIVVLVFIINAINMIDGMDGLASGISIFALCVYGTLFLLHGLWYYSILAFSTVGVLTTFFYYNVFGNVKKGRKLFMGDSGSLALGYILGFLSLRYVFYNPDIITPIGNTLVIAVSPILIPMLDVTRVMLSRVKRHKHLFKPDRNHIHHKLMDMNLGKSTALVVLLCITSGFCAINFALMRFLNSFYIFSIDIIVWILLNIYFTHLINKRNLKIQEKKTVEQVEKKQIEKESTKVAVVL